MRSDLESHKSRVIDVLDRWYPGDYIDEVEKKIAKMYSSSYCISTNSGTSSLLVALAGVGVKAGDEVIVSSYTFSAPAFAVEQIGATPVFADINPITWNSDPHTIEKLITDKTTAIIIVHLYGLPANMPAIMKLACKYELKVIEDCAEAFLASINDRPVGTFGDMAIFSFEKSKHITCGSGGAVITNNGKYAQRARKFSILGYSNLTPSGHTGTKDDVQHPLFNRHYTMGYNFRLPELCAAVLSAELDYADLLVGMRVAAGNIYENAVRPFFSITRQYVPAGYKHTYWTFAFMLPKTSFPVEMYENFRKLYIDSGGMKFFAGWKPTPDEPHFYKKYRPVHIPVARDYQPRLICLNTGIDEETARQQGLILKDVLHRMGVK